MKMYINSYKENGYYAPLEEKEEKDALATLMISILKEVEGGNGVAAY